MVLLKTKQWCLVAAMSGASDAVTVLCRRGKDAAVNETCQSGATALHIAALFNHVAILRALLERGANASVDEFKCSPLIYAVLAGQTAAAKYLAEKVRICF